MSEHSAAELPPLPTVTCFSCHDVVPFGQFCGACGVHLHEDAKRTPRSHSYAAAPHEGALRLSVVTSLFPHLPHRSYAPFRVAFGALVALMGVLAALRLQVPLVAVAALGVPLLFEIYLREVDQFGDEHVSTLLLTAGLGAALGTGVTWWAAHVVATEVRGSLFSGTDARSTWLAGVAVPLAAQIAMLLPVLLMRVRRRGSGESLDGFAIGAASGLGFSVAATFVQLAPMLRTGLVSHRSVGNVLVVGLLHGVLMPVTAAAITGLVGAALWTTLRPNRTRTTRLVTSVATAVVFALAVQVALGLVDAKLHDPRAVVVVRIAAAAMAVLALRIGLHHVLMHEEQDVRIGPPRVCAHCHHIVPEMPFCPQCGVAERSIAKSARQFRPVEVTS